MTARARVWAEVLAEAGAAVAPDPVRGIPLDEAGRADLTVPVDRALRVAPPAGVDGASPWWLLETDVPQDDDGVVLPVIRVTVGAPGQVHALARRRHGRRAGPGPGMAVCGTHGRVPGPGRRRPSEAAARDRGDRAGGVVPGGVRGRWWIRDDPSIAT